MKLFRHPVLLILFNGLLLHAIAQTPPCYTDQLWARSVKNDSSLLTTRHTMDLAIAKASNKQTGAQQVTSRGASSNPTVIPTVIYIVNDGAPASNISMQQIESQMEQLNATYATYGYQFCFAKRNVLDSTMFVPATGDSAGVFRITNPLTNMDINNDDAALKALSTLPSQNYCRIFVVNSMTPVGVLGFAHFPGSVPASLDGIVVLAQVFGSRNYCPSCSLLTDYDLGASLIHEAGHYLNLYHTFQGGCYETTVNTLDACQVYGDYVCDTPPTDGSFGCPSPAPLSCDDTDNELLTDFMDYTTDHCKNEFTPGQNSRMNISVNMYRSTLISTQNLVNTGITCVSLAGLYSTFTCPDFDGCLNQSMTFTSLNSSGFTYHWNFGDGDTSLGITGSHAYAAAGQFLVTLTAINTAMGISESSNIPVYITPCQPITCGYDKWEFEFGEMDFSSGQPVATTHSDMIGYGATPVFPAYYGGLARGDSLGNPLFYFNSSYGSEIFTPSRTFIDSLGYTYYYRLCIPVPAHPNQFCYVRVQFSSSIFNYSIIDASGANIAFPIGKTGTKLTIPGGNNIECMCAVPSCDGTFFWILVYTLRGTVAVYQLTSSEVLTYQGSTTFPNIYGGLNLVPSPNGRLLALGGCEQSSKLGTLLLNFNNATGALTSKLFIPDTITTLPYNPQENGFVAFSPNSRFLYMSESCCFTYSHSLYSVYQYDMYNPDPVASRQTIFQFPESYSNVIYVNFKNGPDKKMYMGFAGDNMINTPLSYRLGVINFPDLLANANNNIGVNLNGPMVVPPGANPDASLSGFGDFIDLADAFDCSWHPGVPQPFTYLSTGCSNYQFNSDDCFTHRWSFGDTLSGAGDTSTQNFPAHNFSGTGTYIITLNASGYVFKDTVTIGAPSLQLVTSGLTACPVIHGNYSIAALQPGVNYNWQVTNGTPASVASASNIDVQWNSAYTNGIVNVVAVNTTTGCTDSASLPVSWLGLTSGQIPLAITGGLCGNQTYSFYGQTLGIAGTYTDTVKNSTGCDSVITLTLSVYTSDTTAYNAAICTGNVYPFFGANETGSGDYTYTLQGTGGCDSLILLHLAVHPSPTSSFSAIICAGDSFAFNHTMLYDAGDYRDTLQTVDGCDSVVTLHLNSYLVSSVSIQINGDTLSTLGFNSYQWYNDSLLVTGATGEVFIAKQNGHYHVAATDTNGCVVTSATVSVTTGISNILSEENVSIYPNPNSIGSWELRVMNELVGAKLQVIDEQGRLVFNSELKTQNSKLELNISAGVYYLRITSGVGSVVRKLVKM